MEHNAYNKSVLIFTELRNRITLQISIVELLFIDLDVIFKYVLFGYKSTTKMRLPFTKHMKIWDVYQMLKLKTSQHNVKYKICFYKK